MLDLSTDVILYAAIASTLALLIARVWRRHPAMSFEKLLPERFKKSRARHRDLAVLAFKKCPQCADQLPVSTLVCDACDYNFLAGSILRHKLLPAPETSIRSAAPQKSMA